MQIRKHILYFTAGLFFPLQGHCQPIELTPFGIPVMEISLLNNLGKIVKMRFIIDSASNVSILDKKNVKKFGFENQISSKLLTANNHELEANEIIIRKMFFGESVINSLPAIEVDLDKSFNMTDDSPIDGVIGLDVLKTLSFEINFTKKEINFSTIKKIEYTYFQIKYSDKNIPYIDVNITGMPSFFFCDSGSNEFISIPENLLSKIPYHLNSPRNGSDLDLSGESNANYGYYLDGSFSIGNWNWETPRFNVSKDAKFGRLGCAAFWPKVHFNFKDNLIGLYTFGRESQRLSPPTEKKHQIIPLWKFTDGKRSLVVAAVKPGSPIERIGIKAGDIILKFGELENGSLTIRGVMEKSQPMTGDTIVVKRGTERLEFKMPNKDS